MGIFQTKESKRLFSFWEVKTFGCFKINGYTRIHFRIPGFMFDMALFYEQDALM